MTKEDIKQALEICTSSYGTCDACPYDDVRNCSDTLKNDARELIIEQEKSIQDQILFLAQQNQEYREQQVKQAKIDVLNKVKNYIDDKIENDYGDMSDSVNYLTIDIDDFDDFIDGLIREVENEQKD